MMHPFRNRLLPLLGLFIVAHVVAREFYLYWYIDWFDIFMHVWGGILLIFAFGTVLEQLPCERAQRYWRIAVTTGFILVCIVLWEVGGVVQFGGFKPDWLIDTSLDLVSGIVGALVGYWWGKRYIRHNI